MNLALHQEDFFLRAIWTFTSSGHGKSPCDGLGAVVKSAARKHLLRGGPEAAFYSAKDFYNFTTEKTSRTLFSTNYVHSNQSSNRSAFSDNGELTDDEVDTISRYSSRSMEVRWLDEGDVQETFQKVL